MHDGSAKPFCDRDLVTSVKRAVTVRVTWILRLGLSEKAHEGAEDMHEGRKCCWAFSSVGLITRPSEDYHRSQARPTFVFD